MTTNSIFSFLKEDSRFNTVYAECISMEKEIKHECYSGSLRTARTISELLIRMVAKSDDEVYNEVYTLSNNGRYYWSDLRIVIEECYDFGLINEDIYNDYNNNRWRGNNSAHGTRLEQITSFDSKKAHQRVFNICLDCFNKFNYNKLDNFEYNFNLDYLNSNNNFSHKEFQNHIHNIHENKFSIEELLEYLKFKEMFFPMENFNQLITPYMDNIFYPNIYHDDLNSIDYIVPDDLEIILDNFDDFVRDDIIKLVEKENKILISQIKKELTDLNEDYLNLEKINYLIDINENNDLYIIIKDLAKDFIRNQYEDIINELQNVTVSKIDKNERLIVESPNLEIVEDEDNIFIQERKTFDLTDDQKEAVEYYDKTPLVVDAGPGSGKTRVIIERVVYLIEKCNVNPSSILVITFTRKATEELRERFRKDTDLDVNIINQMRISTIHGFCRHLISNYVDSPYNYLLRNGEKGLFILNNKKQLGFVKNAFIYNNNIGHVTKAYDTFYNFTVDTEKLINYVKNEHYINSRYSKHIEKYYENHSINTAPPYSYIKNGGFGQDWHFSRFLTVAKSYPVFKELLEAKHACDNNYLIEKANAILEDNHILKNLQYTNILIDEFQDTDYNQKDLFDKLMSICNTFTVVGDIDQSIYGWRGADPDLFKEYAEKFHTITLHDNFRSTRDIVEFNEELIRKDRCIPKELKSTKKYKFPVYYLANTNQEEEAANIVTIINTLYGENKIENYSDIALLFRTNNEVDSIVKHLDHAGIPYYLKDKKDLRDQNEIKAILTLLWYLVPYDKYEYTPGNGDFLNLYGFTDKRYKSNHIFKLSEETMNKLNSFQDEYDRIILMKGPQYINKYKDREDLYKQVFWLNNSTIDKIFSSLNLFDLADLDEVQLRNLGINNRHDLNFFLDLRKLKQEINNKDVPNYEKLTTLDVFYKLLNIIEYYDEINIQKNKESKRIKSNLALVSEIIYDYEQIVGKHNFKGLFLFLNGILSSYSCPIHDLEDNIKKVHIMTIHKSKGLEYPVVILGSLKYETKLSKRKPKFVIPLNCLEHKPDDPIEEEEIRLLEERRIRYVATTRAEELLILSSIDRMGRPPLFLQKVSRNVNRLRELDPINLNSINKISSTKKRKEISIFPELNFEEIFRDYLFCPVYYDITNNVKFRNTYNDEVVSESRLHLALYKIFSKDNITSDEIKNIIVDLKDSFNIVGGSETAQILNKIPSFWEKYGKHYDVLKDCIGMDVTYIMKNCDLNGKIDLIVRDTEVNENDVSIVQFIGSNEKIEKFLPSDLLQIYGFILKKLPIFEQNNINNINKIILHSIKENEIYEIKFDENKEKSFVKRLYKITKKIINDDFDKRSKNCAFCSYKNQPCK